MKFQSINQIKEEFKIEGENISEIKKQLLQILKQIHPDNNNGKFSSESDQEKFILLTKALEFLEGENNVNALTLKEQITDISHYAKNTLTIAEKEEKLNRKKEECRVINRIAVKSRYFFPRLSSGIFFGFCGLIITFAEQLKTHPLFNPLLTYGTQSDLLYLKERYGADNYKEFYDSILQYRLNYLLFFLLILFFYSGVLFILTWIEERKDEAKSEWLLSEEGLRYVLQKFAEQKTAALQQQTEIQFNKRDLETEIKKFYEKSGWFKIPFQPKPQISPSFAEKTAKLYLDEMSNRGLVKVVNVPKFDITYEIKREIIDDLIGENLQLS